MRNRAFKWLSHACRIVLGVTFAASDGEGSISRGWHDAVVPADVLEKAKKQSAFWDLVTPEA